VLRPSRADQKPWVVSDMLTDPLFASARDAALRSPVRSAFSVPVVNEAGECLGSLACHYGEPHSTSPEEIKRNAMWPGMIATSYLGTRPDLQYLRRVTF
jgi:hypothetical protein